jgi:hyperosmotically inducible periplasmic protein
MHEKCPKVRPLLVMLALLTTPGLVFAEVNAGYDSSSSTRASSEALSVPPNNSGRNIRDRGGDAITPLSQSSNPSDVEVTRKIRRALMNDKTLSSTARNVKVITVGGTVILRGPVKSKHEKVAIADKALQIAGNGHVNDQLEIAGR